MGRERKTGGRLLVCVYGQKILAGWRDANLRLRETLETQPN